jgi:hypothetical protein
VEILGALQKLDTKNLSSEEKQFLASKATDAMKSFVALDSKPEADDNKIADPTKIYSMISK